MATLSHSQGLPPVRPCPTDMVISEAERRPYLIIFEPLVRPRFLREVFSGAERSRSVVELRFYVPVDPELIISSTLSPRGLDGSFYTIIVSLSQLDYRHVHAFILLVVSTVLHYRDCL